MFLRLLLVPPRPPELPTVPPPAETPAPIRGPHLRNDAYLTRWIEDFERIVKDGWIALSALITEIDQRLIALETRVADTYTYGQKGPLTLAEAVEGEPAPLNLLALPLRVVRNEVILELVAACEVSPATIPAVLQVQHNGSPVGTLTISPGQFLREIILPTPRAVLRNDVLRVQTLDAGDGCADVVVQIRCR